MLPYFSSEHLPQLDHMQSGLSSTSLEHSLHGYREYVLLYVPQYSKGFRLEDDKFEWLVDGLDAWFYVSGDKYGWDTDLEINSLQIRIGA